MFKRHILSTFALPLQQELLGCPKIKTYICMFVTHFILSKFTFCILHFDIPSHCYDINKRINYYKPLYVVRESKLCKVKKKQNVLYQDMSLINLYWYFCRCIKEYIIHALYIFYSKELKMWFLYFIYVYEHCKFYTSLCLYCMLWQ